MEVEGITGRKVRRPTEKTRARNRAWFAKWKATDPEGYKAAYIYYSEKKRLMIEAERQVIDKAVSKVIAMRKGRINRNFENEILILRKRLEEYEFD